MICWKARLGEVKYIYSTHIIPCSLYVNTSVEWLSFKVKRGMGSMTTNVCLVNFITQAFPPPPLPVCLIICLASKIKYPPPTYFYTSLCSSFRSSKLKGTCQRFFLNFSMYVCGPELHVVLVQWVYQAGMYSARNDSVYYHDLRWQTSPP